MRAALRAVPAVHVVEEAVKMVILGCRVGTVAVALIAVGLIAVGLMRDRRLAGALHADDHAVAGGERLPSRRGLAQRDRAAEEGLLHMHKMQTSK